jgi:hypothetical protein
LLDTAAKAQPGRPLGEINLALGTHVPVAFAAADPARDARQGASLKTSANPPAAPSPNFQFKLKREL